MPPKKKETKTQTKEKKATKQKKVDQSPVSQSHQQSSKLPPFDEFADGLCSWKPKLESFIKTKKFKQIYDFIKPEYETKAIYPPANLIFNAFYLTSLKNLKVVIVGQDPYYKPGQAMGQLFYLVIDNYKGLCFSVPKDIKTPPSLVNIYKCIENDPKIKNFKKPKHGDLTTWAKQGIFMLNDILTVEADKPTSHKKAGWIEFTEEVIQIINKECENIIFLLWGDPAQKKAKFIDENKHYILKACHPSPLSASKGGFFACGHFSKVNEILAKIGKEPIDWNLPA